MTKADIVNEISEKTGIEKMVVQATVESFMKTIRNSMVEGHNVYLRGFGTFLVKKRAEKIGRNISKNTTVVIPEHYIPTFKASKNFSDKNRLISECNFLMNVNNVWFDFFSN